MHNEVLDKSHSKWPDNETKWSPYVEYKHTLGQ